MSTEEQKIFPIDLVIESMKDSGYKDAAHAVAELIDNSIQAGLEMDKPVDVQLICVEGAWNQGSRIKEIAVYDDACGMDVGVLHKALAFGAGTRRGAVSGIGKFGMGLPNASISQADKVAVYSWQKGVCYRSTLDLEEIRATQNEIIPMPVRAEIPEAWRKRIKGEIGESGTLVVWSNLDRLKWKRHKAFFSNTEFIVGRMYRYFIKDDAVSIRMAAYPEKEGDSHHFEEYVLANDPLYLMSGTVAPDPFKDKPAFILYSEQKYLIKHNGIESEVRFKFSHGTREFRRNFNNEYPGKSYGNPGDTPFGKHAGKNLGVSILRGGRELELNNAWDIKYDPVERWWGAEISFDAELDDIFGVTNNKQAATAIKQLDLKDLAAEEGMTPSEVEQYLKDENDPRIHICKISEIVWKNLRAMREELKNQTQGARTGSEAGRTDAAEAAATAAAKKEGIEGQSDKKSKELSTKEKESEMREHLTQGGMVDEDDIEGVIAKALADDAKFIIGEASMPSSSVIFDVTQPAGKLSVTLNTAHPFYKELMKPLLEKDNESADVIKLLFASWALMEDQLQSDEEKDEILEQRMNWGLKAKNMLKEYMS